jgi:hypothetical protein
MRGGVVDGAELKFVMPGLVPGIHVLLFHGSIDVDGRDKPGHDENWVSQNAKRPAPTGPVSMPN